MRFLRFYFFFQLFGTFLTAGNQNLDSLHKVWTNTLEADSNRLKAIQQLGWKMMRINPDSAIRLNYSGLKFSQAKSLKKYSAMLQNNLGGAFFGLGLLDSAEVHFHSAIDLYLSADMKKSCASPYNNLGLIAKEHGNYNLALEYFQKAFKINEEVNNQTGIAVSHNNIGAIQESMGEIEQAKISYRKSLQAALKSGDLMNQANAMGNLGNIFDLQNQMDSAKFYQYKGLEIRKSINDPFGMPIALVNLATLEFKSGNQQKALDIINQAEEKFLAMQNLQGVAHVSYAKGNILNSLNRYTEAEKVCKKGLTLSRENGFLEEERDNCGCLRKAYEGMGKHKEALEYYNRFINLRDSIINEENKKDIIRKQFQFEYAKKSAADSTRTAEEKKVIEAKLEKEKTQRIALYGGLTLVLVFSVFIYGRFRVTRQQKKIIEEQKHLVEEKQREVLDSISYARRLQNAILPPITEITKSLPESFVLYKPKDIVAGDFYWFEKIGGKILIAAADCTGHGVPGAMVSVVCSNALKRAVKEFGLTDPGDILNKTREFVIETFAKSEKEVKDGMDIALIQIDYENCELAYSGANNPLWIIQNNEISEIKAQKQPVGLHVNPVPFESKKIKFAEGTSVFIFTDGFADQFGGPNGKKFKYKPMQNLLIESAALNMRELKDKLDKAISNWMGVLEQVDDICVIGIKL